MTDDILKYLAVNQDVRAIVLVNEQTKSEADEVEEKKIGIGLRPHNSLPITAKKMQFTIRINL